ncbi:MAG: amidohydrolase, partial [Lachnospiraceae bacterium]|nr:amidohydrolase [Lachnospiraceae bacterium]
MDKQQIYSFIDAHAAEYAAISHEIWGFAELSLKEQQSAALYVEALKKAGFEVETGLSGIDTAFLGKYTAVEGGPVIGILGEYDALSGLSQKAGSTVREPADRKDDAGHGCGHNMLGAGSFAAACAVKFFLEQTKTPGTVIFYGCPGEEGGAAKAYLARDRYWEQLDAALSWHPSGKNAVTSGTNNSCTQVLYKYKGVAAHAAGNPEAGRSALDAVELMNIGVNYLREHMKKECSVHYAMVDGGGISPNVVQPHASVLYMVRACRVKDTLDLQERVDRIAEGAALMTGTTYERIFVDGTANLVPNSVLEEILWKNMHFSPLPVYTEAEMEYAKQLRETFAEDDGKPALSDKVEEWHTTEDFKPGSTDVGDVSWQTPTGQIVAATFPQGSP